MYLFLPLFFKCLTGVKKANVHNDKENASIINIKISGQLFWELFTLPLEILFYE